MSITRPLPHMKPDLSQFREYLAEMAWLARVHSDLIERYAQIGDDTGLEYAVRNLIAVTRNTASVMRDLKTCKFEQSVEKLYERDTTSARKEREQV